MDKIYDFFMGETVKRTDYLYATPHVVTLIIVALLSILLIFWARKMSDKTKSVMLYIFFGILLTFEILSRVLNLIKGKDIITTLIPMHFCSIIVWVMIISIVTRSKHLLNIAAIGGLIATVAFLVYPSVGFNVEVLKFSQYYSVITHCLGFLLVIFLMSAGLVSFKWKDIWAVILFMVLVYGYSFLLNFVWYKGSNYMYYLENLLPVKYSVFLMIYIAIVIVYILSFYIIYDIHSRLKKKKNN